MAADDILTLDSKTSLAVKYAAARLGRAADGELVKFLSQRYLDKPEKTRKEAVGAQELGAEDFQKFDKQCPKCGFEWDG